jgi:protein phosphatase
MKISATGRTDVGRKRTHNEDAFALYPEHNVFVLADGMGGHASGEVASAIAVETVGDFYMETGADQDRTWPYKESKKLNYEANRLSTSVKLANLHILEKAQATKGCESMGTTVVAMLVSERAAYMAHVGDSRGYMVRDGQITQLTSDHSLLNDYLRSNRLTPEEIDAFPHKNVIVRALGMRETVQVDITPLEPRSGDVYLLCSDGLSGMVTDEVILEAVEEHPDDLDAACEQLIDVANANGGHDNVTAVLVRCGD